MGFFIKAETFSALGRIPPGEMKWPRKFAVVAPSRAFEVESLRLCLRRRSKRARIIFTWARVEDDHIIEVGRHLCQIFNDFVNHFDEPAGRSTAALGHDQPLVEARRSAKRRERDGVLVRGNLVERGDQIEERKHPSLRQGVEDLVHARNRQLAEVADLMSFVQFTVSRTPPDFFGMTTCGF